MILQTRILVREAETEDLHKLANLIHFEAYVHRHLDYRPPLDWVGEKPFLLLEQRGFNSTQLAATLACPPDPPSVAWIRAFAANSRSMVERGWDALWPPALEHLRGDPLVQWVAAIPMQEWFETILRRSGFESTHSIVMLNWDAQPVPAAPANPRLHIRVIGLPDLPVVEQIDLAAFPPLWQNSQGGLELAFRQSAFSTLAELDGVPVGYQISTATPVGGHLARLAVLPHLQGQGIGFALLSHLLEHMRQRGARSITVNTQANNSASLRLYEGIGFQRTGEEYKIYQYAL
jgi:ribosomal-protein-alanine N-acetyltransferase